MDNAKLVYIIRHAESEDASSKRFQSRNSKLSKRGKTQAKRLAIQVRPLRFEKLISSNYARAIETAQEIAHKTGLEIKQMKLFSEIASPQEIHGKSFDDSESVALFRHWYDSLSKNLSKPIIVGTETFRDIMDRADRSLEYLRNLPENNIAVVTHGQFIRAIIARILFSDSSISAKQYRTLLDSMLTTNTGITIIELSTSKSGRTLWRLKSYNLSIE